MLFRDFHMMAAIAYAAQSAAEGADRLWTELDEGEQGSFIEATLAIARGEATKVGEVFDATASAIFNHNEGQGLLALEELMNLGSAVMSLELHTEEYVAGKSISATTIELLHELAERRQVGAAGRDNIRDDPRFRALEFADGDTAQAEVFAGFLANARGVVSKEAASILTLAIDVEDQRRGPRPLGVSRASDFAEKAVELAESYEKFIHPAPDKLSADPALVTGNLNGSDELAQEPLPADTVQ